CLPSKLSFCSKNPCPHTFRKWCSQIPESLFNFTGIRNKAQQNVERGFRFLKSPEFLTSSLYLKKPERIEALLM
ncbi:hypothetical protein, partial [Aeromonas caviae]|uniref:hypothetical protein n=1 Tax=Aeromonas caviae TaxID=648 RepID=UPI001CC6E8BA